MFSHPSKQRRLSGAAISILAGVIVAIAANAVIGIILIVAGLMMLVLSLRGYETVQDAARGQQAYAADGSSLKNSRADRS